VEISWRKLAGNLHYAVTALLAIAAIPAIHRLGLPMRLNWRNMLVFYWVGLATKSILRALLLCVLSFPLSITIVPFLQRCRQQKARIFFAPAFFGALLLVVDVSAALLLTLDAMFIAELAERARVERTSFLKRITPLFLASVYLFIGISLVLAYNDIIIASRSPISYDSTFNRIDSFLLGGTDVSQIAHATYQTLPPWSLRFLDFAYFQMFGIVGAAFLITGYGSIKRALYFSGACLTAYYLGLLLFYMWPTYGPFISCSHHFERYPAYLTTYIFQKAEMLGVAAIAQHKSHIVAGGYYIAFPSLHIALPIIAMWSQRHRKTIFWLLMGYSIVIAIAIVFLEWHYVIDLLGGIAVAAVALAIVKPEESPLRA
jgi:hypothetical protein